VDRKFFIVTNGNWALNYGQHQRRLERQLSPLGGTVGHLAAGCHLLVKFRSPDGIKIDESAKIDEFKGEYFVKSEVLASHILRQLTPESLVFFFFEGTSLHARCIVWLDQAQFLDLLETHQPTLRFAAFGLPPPDSVLVDAPSLVRALYQHRSLTDVELFSPHASIFLDAPHILLPLCAHVSALSSSASLEFTIQLKKVAEQLRTLLLENASSVRIRKISRSHVDTWAEAQGRTIAFLDGGVARISALAHIEPMALRVGIYAVRPGDRDPNTRETWFMQSFVVGDLIDPVDGLSEETNRKRLMEAVRYVLEPLCGLRYLAQNPDTSILFIHGPLINQFHMYDEGEPNYIPRMSPEVLRAFGIEEAALLNRLKHVPEHAISGKPMWNQFMAVYGYVMSELFDQVVPTVGVVERVGGRGLAQSLLRSLLSDRLVTEPYVRRLRQIFERYDINDEFLFGCLLREGEFTTPLVVNKNLETRARDRWQPVVRQYPSLWATMLKTDDGTFPFRVEMNPAALQTGDLVLRLTYHTSRLLPRYAFPVGLDIADKYAKVPDWISKGVSDEIAARVFRRALQSGDPQILAQVRRLLAVRPRDFFYRPTHEI
jgi:hypothetical protein